MTLSNDEQAYLDHANDHIQILQRRYSRDYDTSAACARWALDMAERLLASTEKRGFEVAHTQYRKLYDMAFYRLTAAIQWGL